MCDTDTAARRKRDLERYHRRTAERRAKGLCLKCGKQPPAPERTQCEPCAEKQRAGDLARYHRRTAERLARGLCPKCGKRPPAPERSQCGPCLEKDAAADRARDARLRAAGMPRRNPEKARIAERRRRERQIGREKSARRRAARLAAGLCTSCGKRPSAEDGTQCEPCRETRRAFEHERYAVRRAAGLCGACGGPTLDGGSRCGPCAVRETERRSPEQKNAAARRLYARRRAQGLCTDCGEPSLGAARCEPCARRSYHRLQHFRGLPLYPPQYTVVELATGDDHGTYDSWDEVALCLAFARLSLEEVEALTDQSPMATLTAAWD